MAWKATTDALKERALRNHSAFRKAIAAATQKRVAELCDVAPPTLSDFDSDYMERCCLILAAAGLKLVGVSEKTVEPDELRFMLKQQIRYLENEVHELDTPTSGFGALAE
jgi:hypothetical protein